MISSAFPWSNYRIRKYFRGQARSARELEKITFLVARSEDAGVGDKHRTFFFNPGENEHTKTIFVSERRFHSSFGA